MTASLKRFCSLKRGCSFLFAFYLLFIPARISIFSQEYSPIKELGIVTVRGEVRLVGSDRFKRFVVTEFLGTDWYVHDSEISKFFKLEHKKVVVRAFGFCEEIYLANRVKLGLRYSLRNISIEEIT